MNTQSKYIARYLFGEVTGLKFNKKNFLHVCKNRKKYKIMNKSIYGIKFIEMLNNGKIKYCLPSNKENVLWDTYELNDIEFYNKFKIDKKNLFFIAI